MSPRFQNFAVGAFIIIALAVLVFGVYFLKETVPGRAMDVYRARFTEVSNLQSGEPVRVNGVRVGRVTGIRLEDRHVIVSFEVRSGTFIPADSEVRIQNIGLMGERQLSIRRGDSERAPGPGEFFEGTLDAGIAEAMGAAGEALLEADRLVRTLRALVDSTVARPGFAERVNDLMASAEEVSERLALLVAEVDPQVREGVDAFAGLGRDARAFAQRQEPRIERMLEDGAGAAERAHALAERGERAAETLEAILARLEAGEGTAGALLTDSTLHLELAATLRSADSLFRSMRENGLNVRMRWFR